MAVKIELGKEEKREIAQAFGVTVANVGLALLYKRNSPQSEKIRQMALQKGGRMVDVEVTVREVAAPTKVVKILDKHGNVKAAKTI